MVQVVHSRTGDSGGGDLEHPRQWLGAQWPSLSPWAHCAVQSRQARPEQAQEPSSGTGKWGRLTMLPHAKALLGDPAPPPSLCKGACGWHAWSGMRRPSPASSLLDASLNFRSPVRAPVNCCASLSGGSRRSGGMGSPSSLSSPSSSCDGMPVSRVYDLGSGGSSAAPSPSRLTLLLLVGGAPSTEPSGVGLPRPSRTRFLPPSSASSFSPPAAFAASFPLESSFAPSSFDAPPAWQKVLLRALRLADGRLDASESGSVELSPAFGTPPDSSLKSSQAVILGL